MPQSYKGYEIPAYTDDADAIQAFKDYTDDVVKRNDEVNVELAAKAPFSYGTAEPTTTVEGFIWFDENDDPATPKYWDGSEFVPFPSGAGDAVISSPAATGQYTDTGVTYDYYTFTASGTLTVDTAGFADILVVGGGGQGNNSGGGGAGGYLAVSDAYLPAGTATVTVGAGGAGGEVQIINGSASRLGSYFASGGGGGGGGGVLSGDSPGNRGGSGGGGRDSGRAGGAGDPGLGNDGGDGGGGNAGGGGGGAGAAGQNAANTVGGNGGAGLSSSITGASVTRGGGGAGVGSGSSGTGGTGGGGNPSTSGTANTGGGGGGDTSRSYGNGGSGVVIVRVKV